MKKTIIAIAALAAAGAASAQSSVTMYGRVDTGYAYTKESETNAAGTKKETTKTTGFKNATGGGSSRLGFKGEEALGNGLSATFGLEMGFDGSTGQFASAAFNRGAFVGLKGAFGEVRLGKSDTPMNNFDGTYKAVDNTESLAEAAEVTISPYIPAGSLTPVPLEEKVKDISYVGRPTGIFYAGSFSGVTVEAALGQSSINTKDNAATAKNEKTNTATYGLGLSYETGPVAVGAAFQVDKAKSTGVLQSYDYTTTSYGVGASYDLTAAKLFAQYKGGKIKAKLAAENEKASYDQFAVGVSVPFGATTLSAEYGYNKGKEVDATETAKAKGNVFAVQAAYAFSKRTSLVARAGQVANWKTKDSKAKYSKQEYSVGLVHKF